MHHVPAKSRRRRATLLGASAIGLALLASGLPASGQSVAQPQLENAKFSFQGEEDKVSNLDARPGEIAPLASQRAAAQTLGADTARWNHFGTPHVLMSTTGYLSGPKAGAAVDVARSFVDQNRDLFRLSASGVASLKVVGDAPLLDAPDLARQRDGQEIRNLDVAHVVTFRQTFDDLVAAWEGLLTVGVQRDGRVAWVSSSVTGDDAVSGTQSLGAVAALKAAAADAGMELGTLTETGVEGVWTTFSSSASRDVQRARLMALPTPTDGVRRVWETTLLKADHSDDEHGDPAAYISFVDAETGKVWVRDNRVDHLANGLKMTAGAAPTAATFSGSTDDAGSCTPADQRHGPYAVDSDQGQLTVSVATTMPNGLDDDVKINLYRSGQDAAVASQDLLTSPEVLTYAPGGGVPAGDYFVEICEFTPGAGSIGYAGSFSTGPTASAEVQMPRWRVFPANPNFVDSNAPDADTRQLWCWISDSSACQEEQQNIASRVPWDVLAPSLATFTTMGNNATTSISEVSFLTPDTVVQRPYSPDRRYDYPWKNTWFTSSCDPRTFDQVGGNDDDAATANLFAMHNRMHDWSYYLGFTELNSNLQVSNFGNTAPHRENDPEVGTPRPAAAPSTVGTTPTRSPCRTASRRSPTSTSGSRSRVRSTPPAPTVPTTWRWSRTSTVTRSATGWWPVPTPAPAARRARPSRGRT